MIYVDFLINRSTAGGGKPPTKSCNMWSSELNTPEGLLELHEVAGLLRVRQYFRDRPYFPHYDLNESQRKRALALRRPDGTPYVEETSLINFFRPKAQSVEEAVSVQS